MQQVEKCFSVRTVLNLLAATSSLKHCFVIPFIDHYFKRKFINYVILLVRWGLFLIIMIELIVSMVCSCIVHHKVMYSRIALNGTNSDISTLERLKVLPSQTSSALIDSLALYWVIWILLSPLSCYNGFRKLKDE